MDSKHAASLASSYDEVQAMLFAIVKVLDRS